MHPIHLTAINVHATIARPIRHARMRRLSQRSLAPVSVSFYHRVADHYPNGWTISRHEFRRHVEYCRDHLDLVDLAEVQRRVGNRDSRSPALAITFDDGYADNCDFALPLLIEHGIPCTYFVTTTNIRNRAPFPHDTLAGQPLPTNTVNQLRELAAAGIEIGCHTRTHIDFARVVDPVVIRNEILDAKDELEQMIGMAVRYFAFPYGLPAQLTQAAIETVHQAGFAGFCSAFGAYNLIGRDPFHIRRFHGDPEFPRLRNWLSYDPRKTRREPAVQYTLPPRTAEEPLALGELGRAVPRVPA